MCNMKKLLFLLCLTIGFPVFAGNHSPLKDAHLTAPTCSALHPDVRPPNCVDYKHIFKRLPLCNTANPSIVPPACAAIDMPDVNLTPGFSNEVTLEAMCADGYEATVPLASSIKNETKHQVYVNYGFPYKKTTGPCSGGGCAIDNLVPISIGGSNTITNLWPIPIGGTWNAAKKTVLGEVARERVCVTEPKAYQYVKFTALTAGSDATNLVPETTYTATVTVGSTPITVSVLGSAAQTFTTLVSEINTDLSTNATATLDIPKKRIKITAAVVDKAVVITTGTLFASPLAHFSGLSVALAGHVAPVPLPTIRGEITGNWKNAYTKYVTNLE
jgi:hypothetical protein